MRNKGNVEQMKNTFGLYLLHVCNLRYQKLFVTKPEDTMKFVSLQLLPIIGILFE